MTRGKMRAMIEREAGSRFVDPTDAGGQPRSGAQAVERALAVLRFLERSSSDMTVSDVAAGVGLTVSTTHRLVRTLVGAELVAQDEATERYHLGPGAVLLGKAAMDRLGFADAVPHMEEFTFRTGEATNLGVRAGMEVAVVLNVPSPQPLRIEQQPGARNPAHACAMGKILLAFGPSQDLTASEPFESYTPNTIATAADLEAELARIRAVGYSETNEERLAGVRAFAVPLLSSDGQIVAALSVQGPSARLTDDRKEEASSRG